MTEQVVVKVNPVLLDREQAAKVLSVSIRWFDARSAQGEIPGRILLTGRMPRWPYQTLVDWAAAGCPPAKQFQEKIPGAAQCSSAGMTETEDPQQSNQRKANKHD